MRDGYVPTHRSGANKGQAIGRSGVTIGIGCDLGGRSEDDLLRLGLPAALIEKLTPYLGKRRREAQQALAARPLQLSQEEAAMPSAAIAGRSSSVSLPATMRRPRGFRAHAGSQSCRGRRGQ